MLGDSELVPQIYKHRVSSSLKFHFNSHFDHYLFQRPFLEAQGFSTFCLTFKTLECLSSISGVSQNILPALPNPGHHQMAYLQFAGFFWFAWPTTPCRWNPGEYASLLPESVRQCYLYWNAGEALWVVLGPRQLLLLLIQSQLCHLQSSPTWGTSQLTH